MNSNGHYFRRITKTSIIPDEPGKSQLCVYKNIIIAFQQISMGNCTIYPNRPYTDAPYINTPTQITAVVGGELRIKCRVESLVPFTVSWIGFNCPRQTWNFR
jgi:hypothetical protein